MVQQTFHRIALCALTPVFAVFIDAFNYAKIKIIFSLFHCVPSPPPSPDRVRHVRVTLKQKEIGEVMKVLLFSGCTHVYIVFFGELLRAQYAKILLLCIHHIDK